MLDKELIKRKISLIQEELSHLESYSKLSLDEIAESYEKKAIIERILERVINRAIDINQHLISELADEKTKTVKSYKNTFIVLADQNIYSEEFGKDISKSVGTRNVLVHEYNNVDYKTVYNSIEDCLHDYTLYCDYLLNFLEKPHS